MKVTLTKSRLGLVPADPESNEWYEKIKFGATVHSDFKKFRNYEFHKKLFSLLTLAFDYWQPGEINSKYGKPEKSFDRFRKDVTILAGYYHTEIRLDGTVRVCADSISFAKMDHETFEKLYQNVLTVLMDKILTTISKEEIEDLTQKMMSFA